LYRISPQGREFIVKVVEEEETFNEVPVFDGRENPVNAAVLEESDIWEISAHTIRRMMNNHPDMCHGVVLNLSQNLRNLMDMVEQLLFYQVTHRLARLLCQLSVEQQQASLTQQQLAARLGTVREVVARSLRQLQRSGAIQTRRGRVEVINPDILRDWSQGPM
jgi:CRP/FNR family transcriptional regulator